MRQFHCDQVMQETRVPLISGRVQIEVRCMACGQQEREIRAGNGKLWRWINLSLKARLAESETQSV